MTPDEALKKLLDAHRRYYDINETTPTEPFSAEATFQMYDKQYLLLRSVKISESESGELVYFACADELEAKYLQNLANLAWEKGILRVDPHESHQNTDIVLYVIADKFNGNFEDVVKRCKFYKNYRFGLHGYSHFKMLAYEISSSKLAHNRMGKNLVTVIKNTLNQNSIKE